VSVLKDLLPWLGASSACECKGSASVVGCVIGVREHGDEAHLAVSLVLDREMQAAKMVWSLFNYGWDKMCGGYIVLWLFEEAKRRCGEVMLANKKKAL
jgi:hypothetical protein